MLSQDNKALKFDQDQKADKAPFITYQDLDCLMEKICGCKNNRENSSTTTKIGEHIPSGFWMSTVW